MYVCAFNIKENHCFWISNKISKVVPKVLLYRPNFLHLSCLVIQCHSTKYTLVQYLHLNRCLDCTSSFFHLWPSFTQGTDPRYYVVFESYIVSIFSGTWQFLSSLVLVSLKPLKWHGQVSGIPVSMSRLSTNISQLNKYVTWEYKHVLQYLFLSTREKYCIDSKELT